MNYISILETKEIVRKQIFDTKQVAIDYFESQYGEEIYNQAKRNIESLNKSKENIMTKYQASEKEDKKLEEIERKLERQREILSKQPTTYEKRLDPWKKRQFTYGENQLMLQVGSIYKRSSGFEVVEEKHYIKVENADFPGDSKEFLNSLPLEYKQKNQFLYILCGENAQERAIKLIVKLRGQLSREYKKDTTRL